MEGSKEEVSGLVVGIGKDKFVENSRVFKRSKYPSRFSKLLGVTEFIRLSCVNLVVLTVVDEVGGDGIAIFEVFAKARSLSRFSIFLGITPSIRLSCMNIVVLTFVDGVGGDGIVAISEVFKKARFLSNFSKLLRITQFIRLF